MTLIRTTDDFARHVEIIEGRDGYRRPAAFGIGLATVKKTGGADEVVLDTRFAAVNCSENFGTAAVLSDELDRLRGDLTAAPSTAEMRRWMDEMFFPFFHDGQKHSNILALERVSGTRSGLRHHFQYCQRPVVVFIDDLDSKPQTAEDAYLRLHLLSHRKVPPHGVNLDGVFGLLSNNLWTNIGPILPEDADKVEWLLQTNGERLSVTSVDKFPRMEDFVHPSGVRIADAERVRLGAHLAEGTTVMHEGFCNFNAGTLGKSMVEGRISAGVVVGADSDIGGGASIMGTLSGGGEEVISIGERCLIGANGGTGISLGDDCVIEAGLYLTAGTVVTLPDGTTRKARDMSGSSGLLFRRNSQTGTVEALPREGKQVKLNDELHTN